MDNLNTVFSGAALLLAIASPIITALINSHTQKREYEVSFYLKKKAEVIENYVCCTGKLLRYKSVENTSEYGAAYGEVLLYVSDKLRKSIIQLNDLIQKGSPTTQHEYTMFSAICERLSEETPRIKKNQRNKVTKN